MALFKGSREPALYLACEWEYIGPKNLRHEAWNPPVDFNPLFDHREHGRHTRWRHFFVFYLIHRNQIIESMHAEEAYRQITWNGSFFDFLSTWFYKQDCLHYGPLNPCSTFEQHWWGKNKRYAEEDPLVWVKEE